MKVSYKRLGKRLPCVHVKTWTVVGIFTLLCAIFQLTEVTGYAASYSQAASRFVPATTGDWTTYMGNNGRTGYNSAETVITVNTAPNLKIKWTHSANGSIYSQPIVASGLVYWGSRDGYEHATDLNGNFVWATQLGTTSSQCQQDTTGVVSTPTVATAVIGGKTTSVLYVGGGNAHMYALNALTGAILWSTSLGSSPSHFLWSSPAVYNGNVYEGVASLDDCPLVQGQLVEMNGSTGAIEHTFNVVPNGCLGGGVWASPAIDESAGLVFIATGNGGTCGSSEPYTEALVKLNASDLSYVSSWQIPPNQQIGDGDFGATPTLFTATINGTLHNMVGVENKNGYFYAFDRTIIHTGPLWSTEVGCSGCRGSQVSAAWDGTALYVGTHKAIINGQTCAGSLSALNPATGAYIWRHCMRDGALYAGVMVVPGVVVIGEGPFIIVMDTKTGSTLYRYENASDQFVGSATISGGVLYFGAYSPNGGTLFAFAP